MLLRGQNLLGYRHYSDDVVRAFVRKSAENGMDVFRIFDALNDLRNLRTAVEGDKVEMGQPILVTEAMKMETEVQSPIAGLVKKIYVQNGDAVSPDETLVEIEDES